jgi:hypothetical protein
MVAARKAKARKPAVRRPTVRKPSVRKPTVRKAPARKKAARPVRKAPVRFAGVGNDAVQKATGRAWAEWLKLLDRAGAKKMSHKDIALMLSRKFEVPNWWCQMVTVGYEQARGLRTVNQGKDGFSANASRTIGVPVADLYDAWENAATRTRWLQDAPVEVRRSTDGKSMRIAWKAGNSKVDVGFVAKGPGKSAVQVSHGKLKSAAEVVRQKSFWKDALERLESLFEPVTNLK